MFLPYGSFYTLFANGTIGLASNASAPVTFQLEDFAGNPLSSIGPSFIFGAVYQSIIPSTPVVGNNEAVFDASTGVAVLSSLYLHDILHFTLKIASKFYSWSKLHTHISTCGRLQQHRV